MKYLRLTMWTALAWPAYGLYRLGWRWPYGEISGRQMRAAIDAGV